MEMTRVGTNSGHGHAWERPDGVKARCGGPGMCAECSRDLSEMVLAQRRLKVGIAQGTVIEKDGNFYQRMGVPAPTDGDSNPSLQGMDGGGEAIQEEPGFLTVAGKFWNEIHAMCSNLASHMFYEKYPEEKPEWFKLDPMWARGFFMPPTDTKGRGEEKVLHSQHWNNPETGQAECNCCCGWALDTERQHKALRAIRDMQPLETNNFALMSSAMRQIAKEALETVVESRKSDD